MNLKEVRHKSDSRRSVQKDANPQPWLLRADDCFSFDEDAPPCKVLQKLGVNEGQTEKPKHTYAVLGQCRRRAFEDQKKNLQNRRVDQINIIYPAGPKATINLSKPLILSKLLQIYDNETTPHFPVDQRIGQLIEITTDSWPDEKLIKRISVRSI